MRNESLEPFTVVAQPVEDGERIRPMMHLQNVGLKMLDNKQAQLGAEECAEKLQSRDGRR